MASAAKLNLWHPKYCSDSVML